MTSSLTGKVAIVTGASRGIGRAAAEALGRRGASVVVNFAERADAAAEVVDAIEAEGGRALAVQARLDGRAPVERLFAIAIEAFGGVDALVLNAGTARFAPVATFDEAEVDAVLATNVKATFFAFQQAAEHLRPGGRIVAVSAALTAVGYPNTMLYAGTKGAVEQFALAASKELGPKDITVNVVAPGATETDLYLGLSTEASREVAKGRSPMGRLAAPADVGDAIAMLCGNEARWVSGQIVRVNGAALW